MIFTTVLKVAVLPDRWRNDRSEGNGGGGPYFASSDYGRNIHVWDIAAKRYITKMNVPVSAGGYKRYMAGKDKSGKMKQHIPLAWHKKDLLSSTIQGELLQWTFLQGKGKYKVWHLLSLSAMDFLSYCGFVFQYYIVHYIVGLVFLNILCILGIFSTNFGIFITFSIF